MKRILVSLALFSGAGLALAGEWKSYGAAFPPLPCSDGWAACVVGGAVVSPGMVLDAAGRPQPADGRFGFFAFDALPGLSPFTGLSAYEGGASSKRAAAPEAEVAAVAAAPPPREAAPPPQVDPAVARAAAEAREAAATQALIEKEARRAADAARKAAENADGATRAAMEKAAREAEAAAKKATADAAVAEQARKAADAKAADDLKKAQETARVAEEARKAEDAKAAAAAAAAAATAAKTATPAADPAASSTAAKTMTASAAPESTDCTDLVALEPASMMGQLGVGRRKCLETRLSGASAQTEKSKVSRVLISDAQARGDKADWEKLMKRHLEDIDRSDPNLCFTYAIHLSRGGAGRAQGVIRWSEYALENKQQWSGSTYTKNVYNLYKLRAQAANALWQDAEQKFVAERDDEKEAAAKKYRGMAKDFSREWLDYAKASAQSTTAPLALCVSAAGNKDFCEG